MLLFFLIVGNLLHFFQEFDPGFYLTQKTGPNCERSIKLSQKKNDFLCLTQKPIIPTTKFIAVTDIRTNPPFDLDYVDLTISDDAVSVLKALSASLRSSKMVLILDNELVGTLDYNETQAIRNNQIRISVKSSTGRMQVVHKQLVDVVEANKKHSSID
jgi:hypothetical protein